MSRETVLETQIRSLLTNCLKLGCLSSNNRQSVVYSALLLAGPGAVVTSEQEHGELNKMEQILSYWFKKDLADPRARRRASLLHREEHLLEIATRGFLIEVLSSSIFDEIEETWTRRMESTDLNLNQSKTMKSMLQSLALWAVGRSLQESGVQVSLNSVTSQCSEAIRSQTGVDPLNSRALLLHLCREYYTYREATNTQQQQNQHYQQYHDNYDQNNDSPNVNLILSDLVDPQNEGVWCYKDGNFVPWLSAWSKKNWDLPHNLVHSNQFSTEGVVRMLLWTKETMLKDAVERFWRRIHAEFPFTECLNKPEIHLPQFGNLRNHLEDLKDFEDLVREKLKDVSRDLSNKGIILDSRSSFDSKSESSSQLCHDILQYATGSAAHNYFSTIECDGGNDSLTKSSKSSKTAAKKCTKEQSRTKKRMNQELLRHFSNSVVMTDLNNLAKDAEWKFF